MGEKLKQKVAVITGSEKGFGTVIAERFATEGVRIAILDQDDMTATQEAIQHSGQLCAAMTGDVSDPLRIKELISFVHGKLGPIDVVVNNAGYAVHADFVDISYQEWRRMLAD